jgi:hypothetical protein
MCYTLLAAAAVASPRAAFAATCFTGSIATMRSSDEWAVGDDAADNVEGWSRPIDVVIGQVCALEHRSVQFCIENNCLFDITHVAQGDVVGAIQTLSRNAVSEGKFSPLARSTVVLAV